MRQAHGPIRMPVVVVALLGLMATGRAVAQEPQWKDLPGGVFSGLPMTLVPVGDVTKDKFPDGKKVWSELFAGMAKDVESQKLLKKLLGCKELQMVVLDKPPPEDFKPPQAKG